MYDGSTLLNNLKLGGMKIVDWKSLKKSSRRLRNYFLMIKSKKLL